GALVINTGLALDIQVPSPIPDKVRISLQKIYKLSRLFLSSHSLAQGQDISYKSLQLAASPNDDHRNTCRPYLFKLLLRDAPACDHDIGVQIQHPLCADRPVNAAPNRRFLTKRRRKCGMIIPSHDPVDAAEDADKL